MNHSPRLLSLAASLAVLSTPLAAQTLKVFLLAGQSNMEGQAYTFADPAYGNWNVSTMEFLLSGTSEATTYLANMPFGFKSSLAPSWLNPRTDAWCVHYDSSNGTTKNVLPTSDPASIYNGVGPLSPGFGVNTNFGSMFGAELAMGIRIADATTDPVFLFKSDKGGTTLAVNWRPPGAVAARGGVVGSNYTNTVNRFRDFLDALDADLLDDGLLNNYGNATSYEICGFFWLQGFNDGLNSGYVAEYGANLIDLIHDVRKSDARIPADLPGIVIESSDQNTTMNTGRANAVATLNAEIPGSAAFFESENMINGNPGPVNWGNNPDGSPFTTGYGFHFHARAENFLELGWIAGGAVLSNSWLEASDFWLDRPAVTSVGFNQANVSTAVNKAANTVTVYWGTSDAGPTATGWDQSASLGAQAAGPITATLTGLLENTTYFFRVNATSTSLAADFWSASNSFTTPLEFPNPELSAPVVTAIQADGATVESTLSLADADVTLVWASSDQGATDVSTWTSASGGGSFIFGSRRQDDVLSHIITGLNANSTYFVRFLGTNGNGLDWSEAGRFDTPLAEAVLTAYYDFEGAGEDRFDDPAGAFADDLAGGRTSALFSSDTPGAFAGTQSVSFDGSYTLSTNSFTTDLGPGLTAYTIMFWIKAADIDQENNNTRLMSTLTGAGSSLLWQIEGFGNNGSNGDQLDLRLVNKPTGFGNWFTPDATNALARSDQGESAVWRHVAIVNSNTGSPTDGGAYAETFVDGSSVGLANMDPRYDGFTIGNTAGRLTIGGPQVGNGSRDFTGLLDDVALFAGVVEDADIAAIAAGTSSPAHFLVGGNPFGDWAGGFSGLTDGNASLDFDDGGLDTGIEWVVGGDPTDGSDDSSNAPTFDNDDAAYFDFTFKRRDAADADADTDIRVEYGSDLDGWRNTTDHGAADGVLIDDSTDLGGGFHQVTVSIPRALAGDGKLFARLSVAVAAAP